VVRLRDFLCRPLSVSGVEGEGGDFSSDEKRFSVERRDGRVRTTIEGRLLGL